MTLSHSQLSAKVFQSRIFGGIRIASRYITKIMAVIIHMHTIVEDLELIHTIRVKVSGQHIHILRSRIIRIRVNPVLGRRMLVAKHGERYARDRILRRCDAITFGGLLREKPDNLRIPNPRRAIAVKFDVLCPPRSQIPNLPRSKGGFGAAERMTSDGDSVVGVLVMQTGEELEDGFADAFPGLPEAVVGVAAFAEFVHVDFVEFEIFGPVLMGLGAAEGNDDELVIVMRNGYETWCDCQK